MARAACELRLAYLLSPESLEEIARSLAGEDSSLQNLAADEPAYELASGDRSWSMRLEPAVFSLEIDRPWMEDVRGLLHPIWDRMPDEFASLQFERVALSYGSAISLEHQRIEDLLTESVVELLPEPFEAFIQFHSGTWHRGHYTLHYGVQLLQEGMFYLSGAEVTAPGVLAQEMGQILEELDEEGLRLLSWPITQHAAEVFTTIDFDQLLTQAAQALHSWLLPFSGRPYTDQEHRQRAELLMKKHGGSGFSAEDEARLGAINETIRFLLPRVTQEDWHLANDMSDRLNEVHDRTQRIRKKYGLNG